MGLGNFLGFTWAINTCCYLPSRFLKGTYKNFKRDAGLCLKFFAHSIAWAIENKPYFLRLLKSIAIFSGS